MFNLRICAVVLFVTLFSITKVSAAELIIDSHHSNLNFTVPHLFGKVTGRLDEFEGKLDFNEKKIQDMKVTLDASILSIHTGVKARDEHLLTKDFFESEKFPKAHFESTRIYPFPFPGHYILEGNLTLKGVTQKTSWKMHYLGSALDQKKTVKHAFTATTTISRKSFGIDYGLTQIEPLKPLLVGDKVELVLNIEAQVPTLKELTINSL